MSTRQDVDFHHTEDWVFNFLCEDSEGVAININDSQLRFRLASLDGSTLMTRTESDGFTITDAAGGECLLRVTPTHQTNAGVVPASRYVWEFRVTTVDNMVLTQATGHLVVLPSLFST